MDLDQRGRVGVRYWREARNGLEDLLFVRFHQTQHIASVVVRGPAEEQSGDRETIIWASKNPSCTPFNRLGKRVRKNSEYAAGAS